MCIKKRLLGFIFSSFFLVLITHVFFSFTSWAQSWPITSTTAREAILIDYETGTILYEKNADRLVPPASMSKLMTIELVFKKLKEKTLSLEDTFLVSEKAWRKGGSKMFVEVGKRVTVEDLLRGIIIQSGNDACIVVAEGISGTEEAFAQLMTDRARELGMQQSVFANATGWPNPNHRMTAHELAFLAGHLIREYPEYYDLFKETQFTFSEITQGNRNPLLYRSTGVDGLKTGYTDAAGYGLTASAIRGGRRVILVVNGLDSSRRRSQESEKLFDWAYQSFRNYSVAKADDQIVAVPVWQGKQDMLPVGADHDIVLTMPWTGRNDIALRVIYEHPIRAPLKAGASVARLVVSNSKGTTDEIPLKALVDVERIGLIGRLNSILKLLIFGFQ